MGVPRAAQRSVTTKINYGSVNTSYRQWVML